MSVVVGMDFSYLDLLQWDISLGAWTKMSADKILGDKTPFKIARRDKILSISWDREGKMPNLSKHFIYDTDSQAN